MSTPLPRWVTLGWASGTLGSSTLLGTINLVVLFYFTEYLGIAPATAGVLIFLSRIWDIAAAVWIGQWSDRCRTRIGRRAPFLFAAGPVCALAYVMLFAAPVSLQGVALEAYVLAALILYATGYSLFVVPYLAVPAEITAVPHERTTMMSWRVVAMTFASLNVAVLGPVLISLFGKGREGYFGMAMVQGVIVLAFMWLCAAVVARAPVMGTAPTVAGSSLAQLRVVLANRPFRVFIGAKLLQLTAVASTAASLLYLARYVLSQDEGFLIRFGALQTLGTLASIPMWNWLGKRYGKRRTYMAAGLVYALIVLSWLMSALSEPSWVTDLRLLLIGVGSAGLLVMGFSLLPDTMAHNTRTSGLALEGTMSAVYSVVEKGTAALGPLLGGLVLQFSGFVSAAGGSLPPAQPRSAIVAIFLLTAIIPAICNVLGAWLLTRLVLEEAEVTGQVRA
ncbi:MAG: MFS transporter [Nevskiaceae bacterium]